MFLWQFIMKTVLCCSGAEVRLFSFSVSVILLVKTWQIIRQNTMEKLT